MTTETWAAATNTAESWTDVRDSANGYVAAGYVEPVYVFGTSGATWPAVAAESTTWTPA